MYSASDYRSMARRALKNYWWLAVGVTLLASILGGTSSGFTPSFSLTVNGDDLTQYYPEALRHALREDVCDIAVHSFKDLPTAPEEDLIIAAVPQRVDPREVLVSRGNVPLAELPEGAKVGTSAPRRVSQLRSVRPDLDIP